MRYTQGLSAVIRARGPGSDIADHAATLSAVVDEISAALVAPSNKGGLAPMPEGPSWEEASLVEYPPGSETLFIQMTGSVVLDVYS